VVFCPYTTCKYRTQVWLKTFLWLFLTTCSYRERPCISLYELHTSTIQQRQAAADPWIYPTEFGQEKSPLVSCYSPPFCLTVLSGYMEKNSLATFNETLIAGRPCICGKNLLTYEVKMSRSDFQLRLGLVTKLANTRGVWMTVLWFYSFLNIVYAQSYTSPIESYGCSIRRCDRRPDVVYLSSDEERRCGIDSSVAYEFGVITLSYNVMIGYDTITSAASCVMYAVQSPDLPCSHK